MFLSLFIQLAQITGPQVEGLRIPSITGNLTQVIANVINILLWAAGIIALFYLIFMGIQYIVAGGDPEKATTARTGVIHAVIGIVIVSAALAILTFVRTTIISGVPVSTGGGTTGGGGGTTGGSGGTTLSTPQNVTVTANPSTPNVSVLNWDDVSGATGYRVQWTNQLDFAKAGCEDDKDGGTTNPNTCKDSSSLPTSSYTIREPFPGSNYYRIRADKSGGQSDWYQGSFLAR